MATLSPLEHGAVLHASREVMALSDHLVEVRPEPVALCRRFAGPGDAMGGADPPIHPELAAGRSLLPAGGEPDDRVDP